MLPSPTRSTMESSSSTDSSLPAVPGPHGEARLGDDAERPHRHARPREELVARRGLLDLTATVHELNADDVAASGQGDRATAAAGEHEAGDRLVADAAETVEGVATLVELHVQARRPARGAGEVVRIAAEMAARLDLDDRVVLVLFEEGDLLEAIHGHLDRVLGRRPASVEAVAEDRAVRGMAGAAHPQGSAGAGGVRDQRLNLFDRRWVEVTIALSLDPPRLVAHGDHPTAVASRPPADSARALGTNSPLPSGPKAA